MMENMKKIAKECLQKQGSHMPQFIFVKGGNAEIMVAPFESDEEKDMMKAAMRRYVTEKKPDFYFYISEAWMATATKEEIGKKRPRDCPERKEILLISKFSRDMRNETVIIPFRREDDKIIFEEEMKGMDEMVTSFNFYLEEGAFEERMKNGR